MPPRRKPEELLKECLKQPSFMEVMVSFQPIKKFEDDALKSYLSSEVQPAQHDPNNIWNLSTIMSRHFFPKEEEDYISKFRFGNDEVEIYYDFVKTTLEKDTRPNAPAVYKVAKQGAITSGIYIRRSPKVVDKSHIELRIFGNSSRYELQFFIPALVYRANIDDKLKDDNFETVSNFIQFQHFTEDLKWFICALDWLKTELHLAPPFSTGRGGRPEPPSKLIKFPYSNLYYPIWHTGGNIFAISGEYMYTIGPLLSNFIQEGKREFNTHLKNWSSDAIRILSKEQPKMKLSSPKDKKVLIQQAAPSSPSSGDRVLMASPPSITEQEKRSSFRLAPLPPLSRESGLLASPVVKVEHEKKAPIQQAAPSSASSSDRVLMASPALASSPVPAPVPEKAKERPSVSRPNIIITQRNVKKPLFEGIPILASITGVSTECIHTTDKNCFIIETITKVKDAMLTFDVAPSNTTLYNFLNDILSKTGKETLVYIFVVPSLSYIIIETVKNIAVPKGKTNPSIFKLFKYDKRGKKYNYTPQDSSILVKRK